MMAICGTAYFDSKGHYFKTPEEATVSDLAGLLGRVGDGDSLAPGIAHILLQKRQEIEQIFADHDKMMRGMPLFDDMQSDSRARLSATITAIR
jgi:hypothetical protein